MTAKSAPIRLKEPLKRPLECVLHTHTSKIDRPAMRAACRKQSYCGQVHKILLSPFLSHHAVHISADRVGRSGPDTIGIARAYPMILTP
jgi:hypothetical protein